MDGHQSRKQIKLWSDISFKVKAGGILGVIFVFLLFALVPTFRSLAKHSFGISRSKGQESRFHRHRYRQVGSTLRNHSPSILPLGRYSNSAADVSAPYSRQQRIHRALAYPLTNSRGPTEHRSTG